LSWLAWSKNQSNKHYGNPGSPAEILAYDQSGQVWRDLVTVKSGSQVLRVGALSGDLLMSSIDPNSEQWLHEKHWESVQVTILSGGSGGQQALGSVVASGKTRRVRELTIRHTGTKNTVVTLLNSGGDIKVTVDVPAETTRVWSSQNGRAFAAGEQPAIQSSDVSGADTKVSAAGVEA